MKRNSSFFHRWRNWVGIILIAVLSLLAIAAPILAPQDNPANPQVFQRVGKQTDTLPHPPAESAWLGTLSGQYDVWFSLVWGLRQAFQFGLTVTLVAAGFGVTYGAISGYVGGFTNNLMTRISDAFMAVPILAVIVFMRQIIVILLENTGAYLLPSSNEWVILSAVSVLQQFLIKANPVIWALILFSWMPYARLVNASVLRLRQVEYVTAAHALGAGGGRIILRHLLPNAISSDIVLAARDVGSMVVLQATFTFIGLGGNSPWGSMLSMARNWIVGPGGNPFMYWWTYIPATLLLIIFSMSWSFVGDSLNEWLNPRKAL